MFSKNHDFFPQKERKINWIEHIELQEKQQLEDNKENKHEEANVRGFHETHILLKF
jgi:hypothetical protein